MKKLFLAFMLSLTLGVTQMSFAASAPKHRYTPKTQVDNKQAVSGNLVLRDVNHAGHRTSFCLCSSHCHLYHLQVSVSPSQGPHENHGDGDGERRGCAGGAATYRQAE